MWPVIFTVGLRWCKPFQGKAILIQSPSTSVEVSFELIFQSLTWKAWNKMVVFSNPRPSGSRQGVFYAILVSIVKILKYVVIIRYTFTIQCDPRWCKACSPPIAQQEQSHPFQCLVGSCVMQLQEGNSESSAETAEQMDRVPVWTKVEPMFSSIFLVVALGSQWVIIS